MIIRFKHFHDTLNIPLISALGCSWSCKMCPISFNIYGMKLHEGDFSIGTAIIHFLDKLHQKINFQSQLNSVLLFK